MNAFELQRVRDITARNRQISRTIDGAMNDLAKRYTTIKGRRFAGILNSRLKELNDQILDNIDDGIRNQWMLANEMNNTVIDGYLASVKISDTIRKSFRRPNLSALNAFLDRADKGMNLSKRVWKTTKSAQEGIENLIAKGVLEGKSARSTAKEMLKYLKGKPIAYAGTLIKGSNIEYQTMRLVANEMNMAFRTADYLQNSKLPFVTGVTVNLSGAHPREDICDDMQGSYPKGFQFTGWHPLCYSDDTEVYTDRGWKLFKDLDGDEQILSLNPETKDLEYSGIVHQIKYQYAGEMIRFVGIDSKRTVLIPDIDMVVTPDHKMIVIDSVNDEIREIPAASLLDEMNDNEHLCFVCGESAEKYGKLLGTENVPYDGMVYDVEIEKNHIIYVRRNGKCTWGSNCICYAEYDTMPKEDFVKYIKTGEIDPARFTKGMPSRATRYLKAKGPKILKYKEKPYWMRDNFTDDFKLSDSVLEPLP